jgi:hypothetical protein
MLCVQDLTFTVQKRDHSERVSQVASTGEGEAAARELAEMVARASAARSRGVAGRAD